MSGVAGPEPTVPTTTVAPAGGEPQQQPPPAKWGTHVMGAPAAPGVHPDNQKAATWNAGEHHQPYVQYEAVERPSNNPLEAVIHFFTAWTHKADTISRNIWHNLKTGPSVTEAAWGKVNLTAKAMNEGGFESLFKQIFGSVDSSEKLRKTFACYLSTATGPVAGTLYLSTHRLGFCSDRPLCFKAPSGQDTWTYYKVVIPSEKVAAVNPVATRENAADQRYIEVVTSDGHEFWFMGFVNFEKASNYLSKVVSVSVSDDIVKPMP